MTYCLGLKVEAGIVFASDSRTNAGVDNINVYSKMHKFIVPDERAFVIVTAGNLATTQAVINAVRRDFDSKNASQGLHRCQYVFEAAEYLGALNCQIQARKCEHKGEGSINLGASFIIGGQIKGKSPEMCLVYPEGNYISPSEANPYFQIGETKYGKPILDRIITRKTSLEHAARCALVSIDSTMRSNVSVGPPVEVAIYRADSFDIERHLTLDADALYYKELRMAWADGLNRIFTELPPFDWENDS